MRRLGLLAAVLAVTVAALLLAQIGWGDAGLYPPKPGTAVPIFLVSNGFHSGLVLPRPELLSAAGRDGRPAAAAVATRFGHYDWVEVGWGDARFYRDEATPGAIDYRLGLRALFTPGNASVAHVVGIAGDPRIPFGRIDVVAIGLSPEGFGRLVARLDATFDTEDGGRPEVLGPGLYGPSLFYRARGTFSLFNLCNHWTARLLDAAGLPVTPLAATLPAGLVAELRLRAGLRPEPRALPVSAATH